MVDQTRRTGGTTLSEDQLRRALQVLIPDLDVDSQRPWGEGHIHATFLVEGRLGRERRAARYVAQRVNTGIFRDPLLLAGNLERVTAHLARTHRAQAGPPPLELARAADGRSSVEDDAGGWWRAFVFVEGSTSLERASSPRSAEMLAVAFGAFLADLADLDPGELSNLLPGFHDLPLRLAQLDAAAERDAAGRLGRSVEQDLIRMRRLGAQVAAAPTLADLPQRVVHNDCKLNNLLVDARSGQPLCVVDLDTVLPGQACFDFGELVRTAASTAAEDEPDLGRVDFELELFEALARGFVAGTRGLLSPRELASLALAGPRMALENAVRFLGDHLDGDAYFRARRPGHNLDRARAQLRLAERMLDAQPAVERVIDRLGEVAS